MLLRDSAGQAGAVETKKETSLANRKVLKASAAC